QDEAMTVSDRIFVMRSGVIEQAGPPAEVYERPRSRFVAEFLGSANLIAARRNGEGLETAFGLLSAGRRPEGESGTLCIRPARIRLALEAPPRNGLRVRIRERIYRGDHMDVWVEPAAAPGAQGALRVRTPPAEALEPGRELWAELPPENLEVLVD